MDLWLAIVLIVVIAAVCGAVAFFAGINHRKKLLRRKSVLPRLRLKNCQRRAENGGS